MINALICCDSFKGSLTSHEVNFHIAFILEKSKIKTKVMAVSDGGEGFLAVLQAVFDDYKTIVLKTIDQNDNEIEVTVLIANNIAYIESAKVVGLNLIPLQFRNILSLSTKGLGILVQQLYQQGIKKFTLGLGGTGTNDYGIGFLQGLGYQFLDSANKIIDYPLLNMAKITTIQTVEIYKDISFFLVSDVVSPAVGEFGAAKLFAKQKNASDDEIAVLEKSALQYLELLKKINQTINNNDQFLGAAGGIALSLSAFFACQFINGAKFILELNHFEELKKHYTYIITGEGKFDIQSLQGKIVGEILEQVAEDKKVVVFTGMFDLDEEEYLKLISKRSLSIYSCVDKNLKNNNFLNKKIAIENLRNAVLKFIVKEVNEDSSTRIIDSSWE